MKRKKPVKRERQILSNIHMLNNMRAWEHAQGHAAEVERIKEAIADLHAQLEALQK